MARRPWKIKWGIETFYAKFTVQSIYDCRNKANCFRKVKKLLKKYPTTEWTISCVTKVPKLKRQRWKKSVYLRTWVFNPRSRD